MLLCDAVCLKDIVLQLLLCLPRIENEKRQKEHALILALQFLEQCFCIIAVGCKVRRNDVHVVAGPHCLLLLLDLGPVKLRDRVFYRFDGFRLIDRLHMHRHDFRRLYGQEIRQHLVTDIRRRDREKTHAAIQLSHLENSAGPEVQC